jgi:hypothetical protein
MSTQFNHNGNIYSLLEEGKDEVCLVYLDKCAGEVFIPKYAMYNDKQYRVTKLAPTEKPVYGKSLVNINASDRRKKPVMRYPIEYYSISNIRGKLNGTKSHFWDEYCTGESEEREITSIIIPDSIKVIGDDTFANFTRLKEISLPDSVTSIGERAFAVCWTMSHLTLSNSLKEISVSAFANCQQLTKVDIPDSVTTIDAGAFSCCYNLTELTIGSGITQIKQGAFEDSKKLKEVKIYRDPFEVMIAPTAFPSSVKISYMGKKTVSEAKIESNEKVDKERHTQKSSEINLDKLINAVIVDGIVTDKERSVIMKKAKAAGYDTDEFEIMLDAKLYEVQSKEDKKAAKSKQEKKTAKPKVEKKVAKLKEEKKAEKAKTEKKAAKSKVEKDARTEKKERVKAKTTEKPKSTRKVAKEEKKPIKKASTKVAKSKK